MSFVGLFSFRWFELSIDMFNDFSQALNSGRQKRTGRTVKARNPFSVVDAMRF